VCMIMGIAEAIAISTMTTAKILAMLAAFCRVIRPMSESPQFLTAATG